jgi:hypothetical protein
VAKGKKKKKGKSGDAPVATLPAKAAKRLRDMSKNPLVADLVAATLVATAAVLKDSKKARRLAASAEDELEQLTRRGSQRGQALWEMALDIGRKSLDALSEAPKAKKAKPGAKAKPKAAAARAAPKRAKSTPKARKSPAKRQAAKSKAR